MKKNPAVVIPFNNMSSRYCRNMSIDELKRYIVYLKKQIEKNDKRLTVIEQGKNKIEYTFSRNNILKNLKELQTPLSKSK